MVFLFCFMGFVVSVWVLVWFGFRCLVLGGACSEPRGHRHVKLTLDHWVTTLGQLWSPACSFFSMCPPSVCASSMHLELFLLYRCPCEVVWGGWLAAGSCLRILLLQGTKDKSEWACDGICYIANRRLLALRTMKGKRERKLMQSAVYLIFLHMGWDI